MIRAGKVKPIAATGPTRFPALPDVSTFSETFPGFEGLSWFGVMAPAGTPKDIVARLNREVQDYVADPSTRQRIAALNFTLDSGTPEQMGEYIRSESARWGAFIARTGITLEQ